MTAHPGLERLRALAAGELTAETARRTAEHVASCDTCRATTQWMDTVRSAARAPVPDPMPENWDRIAERIEAGEIVMLPAEPARRPGAGQLPRGALRVAGVTLLLAAGAAAALPNGWIRTWVEDVRHGRSALPAVEPTAPTTPAAEPAHVVLFVEPHGGAVVVMMEQTDAAVQVRVRLVAGDAVEVHATGGAAAATFRTAPGRLAIAQAGAGDIVLAIPRSLARVRFEVDDRAYLIKEHGHIRILAPAADTAGSEFLFSLRPRAAATSRQ